jgi:hypothetical protein
MEKEGIRQTKIEGAGNRKYMNKQGKETKREKM